MALPKQIQQQADAVAQLEEQLGKQLFRRVNRALQLTATGAELFRAVDEALSLIDNAAQRALEASTTLSVTTTVALASTWLVPRLPSFQKRHPDIDLRVVASNDSIDLGRERIDLAIRFATLEMSQPSGEKLFDYKQFPVCAPALARSRKRPLRTVEDLSRFVLIDFETNVKEAKPTMETALVFLDLFQIEIAGPEAATEVKGGAK